MNALKKSGNPTPPEEGGGDAGAPTPYLLLSGALHAVPLILVLLCLILWRIVFSLLIYIYVLSCLANYGASEAVDPCVVVEKIHEYF